MNKNIILLTCIFVFSWGPSLFANPFSSRKSPQIVSQEEQKRLKEFEIVFGPYPSRLAYPLDYKGYMAYRSAVVEWRQDRRLFIGIIDPSTLGENVDLVENIYSAWDMPAPIYYKIYDTRGRVYEKAQFIGINFQASLKIALEYPHLAISSYQMALFERNELPEVCHPWVPPQFCSDLKE